MLNRVIPRNITQFEIPKPMILWFTKHAVPLQRMLIVPAVLLISYVIAPQLNQIQSLALIAAPFAFIAVVSLFRWPSLGLIILVAASMAFPEEIISNIGLTTIITMGLTGLFVFEYIVQKGELTIVSSPVYRPIIGLIVVAFFSFGTGQLPWYPLTPAPLDSQLGGILIYIVAFLVLFLAANHIKSVVWLQWVTYTFIALGGVFLAGWMVPPLGSITGQFYSYLIPSNGMFWSWLAGMSFAQGFFNKKLHWTIRGGLLGITAVVLYITLFQTRAWVSGWMPALIVVASVLWVGAPKLAYIVSLLAAAGIGSQINTILETFIYVGDNAYSETTRLAAWGIIIKMIDVNPLFGLGPANYSFYTPLFPILGWNVQFNSHNNYVDIIAQTGILGTICFLWTFWEVGRVGWRLILKVRDMEGFVPAYVYGVSGGLVTTVVAAMLGDWVLPYVYNITIRGMRASMLPWLFFGGLIALNYILDRQEQAEVATDS